MIRYFLNFDFFKAFFSRYYLKGLKNYELLKKLKDFEQLGRLIFFEIYIDKKDLICIVLVIYLIILGFFFLNFMVVKNLSIFF
jgi:hypothetical protein